MLFNIYDTFLGATWPQRICSHCQPQQPSDTLCHFYFAFDCWHDTCGNLQKCKLTTWNKAHCSYILHAKSPHVMMLLCGVEKNAKFGCFAAFTFGCFSFSCCCCFATLKFLKQFQANITCANCMRGKNRQ